MIIAIDGPAGTGKSTIAKILSEKLNITFLNSGAFYRGITLSLLRNNIDLSNEKNIWKYDDLIEEMLSGRWVNDKCLYNNKNK